MSNKFATYIASPGRQHVILAFTSGSLIFLDNGLKFLFLLRFLFFLFFHLKLAHLLLHEVVLLSLDSSLRYSAIALIVDHELTIVVFTGIVLFIDQVKHTCASFSRLHSFTALITALELLNLPYILAINFEDWTLASKECVTYLASLWFLRSYILIFITARLCIWEPDLFFRDTLPFLLYEVVVLLTCLHIDHRHQVKELALFFFSCIICFVFFLHFDSIFNFLVLF